MKKISIFDGMPSKKRHMRIIFLAMRLSIFFFLFTTLQAFTDVSYSQKTNISLQLENVKIEQVLDHIEDQSEFFFLYNTKLIDVEKNIDINVKEIKISEVLDQIFDEDVKYTVFDKQIVLSPNQKSQQKNTISGTVFSADDMTALPGVSVMVKGTDRGEATNADGKFTVNASVGEILVVQFIGMISQEITVKDKNDLKIYLRADAVSMTEVVVTALGIKREEKSLGYAVSKVGGDDLNRAKSPSVTSSLSGRVSGVNITSSGTMGGSTNVVIRGGSSITGNNQALYVIDGVPISNRSVNSRDQNRGGGGYDFGNAASDINPEDVESVSILKGASATALYGSRGANGVILITTKKGVSKDRIGVSLSTSYTFDKINESTLPDYQTKYGGGSIKRWIKDVDGNWLYADNSIARKTKIDGIIYEYPDYSTDESWGRKFDPNIKVLPWYALDPNDKDNYLKTVPWVNSPNGPEAFFETGVTKVTNIAIDGAKEDSNFRLSYTNTDQTGIMPNSEMKKNMISFNGSMNMTKKLTATVGVQFNNTYTKGRAGQGYDYKFSRAFMASAGQWMQTSVDYEKLKDYQDVTGKQKTWNRKGLTNHKPQYWDNPYWTAYKNYTEDTRNRIVGNASLNYKINSNLNLTGRATIDHYDFTVEQRIAKGSFATSYFGKDLRIESEYNFDLMLNFNKDLSSDISVNGNVGASKRQNKYQRIGTGSKNGLVVEDLFTTANSRSAEIGSSDDRSRTEVQSVFATASISYKKMLYVDVSARNDWSSTLPSDENSFFYPSISSSFIFSELIESDFLTFGKLRANWAIVGTDAPFSVLYDKLFNEDTYNGLTRYGQSNTRNNSFLKPELSTSYELGLNVKFFNNRLGLDLSYYNKKSTNQIIASTVPYSTGYQYRYVNSGEKQDKGFELELNAAPIKTNDFVWDVNINWSKNISKVVKLADGVDTYTINGNGVNVVAREGEEYGSLMGTDYTYTTSGEKVLTSDGRYYMDETQKIIGNISPDWRAGVSNRFTYKGFTVSALVDIKMGGDLYSKTSSYGNTSGILKETAGNNELGNPVRNDVVYEKNDAGEITGYGSTSGGYLSDGVLATSSKDANGNTIWTKSGTTKKRVSAYNYHASTIAEIDKAHIYDASFVKLREVSISYSLPKSMIKKVKLTNVSFAIIGRNLAILHRNIDHIDPEVTYGSGNMQGLDIGSLPTTRSIGFSVKVAF